MKRFHVHVGVEHLADSIRFYTQLFGAPPTVEKSDYAKWMVEDPRINFAISQRDRASTGIDHLGFQVETDEELAGMRAAVDRADIAVREERGVSCCYAKSDKHWVTDPQGVAWETYRTLDTVPTFHGAAPPETACCAPKAGAKPSASSCCS
ncbi:MAG: VOC family protein [Betaproteobacteria bacterium]|nr:VOC family protein [Betaproteobacteria bacterium]